MFLRRKAHSLRCNQEAQGACFGPQGAYVKLTRAREKDHKSIGWIVKKITMNLM